MRYLLILILPVLSCLGVAETEKLPNIIFILVDDMGWSDLGSYGGEIDTPHLDRLAEEGIRFTQFHNTSKCFPSRACLLTGLYAQQVGMGSKFDRFRNSATLGEVLKTAGYRTYASGKHHSLESLYDRGFDHYWGLRDGASNHFNPGVQREGEVVPAQKRPAGRWWCFDEHVEQGWTPEDEDFYTTDTFTDWAIQFLEAHDQSHQDIPFFLYLSYTAPHDPLHAWPEDIEKYRGTYLEGFETIAQRRYEKQIELGLIRETDYPFPQPTHRPWDSLTEGEQDEQDLLMAIYAAMVDRVDQNIGRLLNTLKQQGELKNTLIFFASDNGGSAETVKIGGDGHLGTMGHWASLGKDWANVSNTPLRFYKNYSYQGGISTPLIAWWHDGLIDPGRISEFPGHFIDIMATLVELTGAEYPTEMNGEPVHPMTGVSLLPIIRGQASTPRKEPLYWNWKHGAAVRREPWKLVRHGMDAPWELYRIVSDKSETRNLADRNPDKVREMEILYKAWIQQWGE